MCISVSEYFEEYRRNHQVKQPDTSKLMYDDELDDLSGEDEVREIPGPPAEGWIFGSPQDSDAKYLWLITIESVLSALECGSLGLSTKRKRLAHTNLSGGRGAYCGGELWFRDSQSIWFNGGSGRYPARDANELEHVAECLRSAGYLVACCGWDEEIDLPARNFREGIEWL